MAAFEPKRAGDPGTEGMLPSLSTEVTLVSADAVEEITSVVSELGIGDDPLRLPGKAVGGGVALSGMFGGG